MSGRPTQADLLAAEGTSVADVIRADLKVLLCGINPGLWTAAVGHHFARPGNRFWKALAASGFTEEVLEPDQEQLLLDAGIGITNLVARASARADALGRSELVEGARLLANKVTVFRPSFVAVLGIGAFRTAFERPKATIGEQPEMLSSARVWVLPNPSGLQAYYRFEDIVESMSALRQASG